MRELLFAVPWWLPTLIALIALAMLVNGNRRQNARMRGAGLTVLLLAVVWGVMSYLVDTPREKCEKLTRRFVQSVVARDFGTFRALMEPGVTFQFAGSDWRIDGRENLTETVKDRADKIGLKSATVTSMRSAESADTVTTTIRVWSSQELTLDQPVNSQWELDWRQTGGQWLLHEIRAIEVSGASPEQVQRGVGAPGPVRGHPR